MGKGGLGGGKGGTQQRLMSCLIQVTRRLDKSNTTTWKEGSGKGSKEVIEISKFHFFLVSHFVPYWIAAYIKIE